MTAASEALEPGISADVRRMLERANYAHLATLHPDGAPHSVPVWVDLDGPQVAILAGPGSRKARNNERTNRIVLLIEADHAQAVTFG
jgi:nitroimidazol reductase NimA-like FMN-containing flavoprotein (pyridoxamine 5'-phosphate oxidase superfamily)